MITALLYAAAGLVWAWLAWGHIHRRDDPLSVLLAGGAAALFLAAAAVYALL